MNNLKNDKGVTLIVLTITIIALLIITGITINSSRSQLAIKKVNNLYSDIDSINTKVSDYYVKNNSLPVLSDNVFLNSSTDLGLLITSKGGDSSIINPNDDGNYYVIDLSKLDNLTLNYGKDFKKWNSSSIFDEIQDLYIINSVSHQIYYPKGVEFKGKIYFTKGTAEIVSKVITSEVADEFKILTIEATKNKIEGNNKVIISSNVVLSIGDSYNKDTLQYAWKLAGDTTDIEYSPFKMNETNNFSLMSKIIENSRDYVIYFKVLDNYGKEHEISQNVTIIDPLVLGFVDDLGTSSTIYLYGNSDEITSGELTITMPDGTVKTITATNDNTTISKSEMYKKYDVTKNGTYIFTATDGEYTTKTTIKISNIEQFKLIDNMGLSYYDSDQKAYNYNGAAVPKGFYIDTNSKIDTGLVITDSIDSDGYSTGNEWVWVPVNGTVGNNEFYVSGTGYYPVATTVEYTKYSILYSFSKLLERDPKGTFYPMDNKTALSTGAPGSVARYREPTVLDSDTYGEVVKYGSINKRGTTNKFSNVEDVVKQYNNDYVNMATSVEKYGGFYIGRYELSGTVGNETEKRGEPLDNIDWYAFYNSSMNFDGNNVGSGMIYGTLWDATMQWLAKSNIPVGYNAEGKSGYGNYPNEEIYVKNTNTSILIKGKGNKRLQTGETSYTRSNNIYDLCGNRMEWTQEGREKQNRVLRGGGYSITNGTYASFRGAHYPTASEFYYSTRPCLYLK